MATRCTKPTRRMVRAAVPHGVNPDIVITVYPSGLIGLREARRRREYVLAVGLLYQQAVTAAGRAERIQRKKDRKEKRKTLTAAYARHDKKD